MQLSGGEVFNGLAQDAGYVPNGPLNSNPAYTFRDNVSKLSGRHNLQFGAYAVASQKNELPQFEPSVNGFITYDTSFTNSTGNPFADLLTGNIANFGQANGQPKYYLRYKILEPYFQDDWRATNRLTLNLGLRLSLYGTVRDRFQQAYNFDPTAFDPATAAELMRTEASPEVLVRWFPAAATHLTAWCNVVGPVAHFPSLDSPTHRPPPIPIRDAPKGIYSIPLPGSASPGIPGAMARRRSAADTAFSGSTPTATRLSRRPWRARRLSFSILFNKTFLRPSTLREIS